MDPFARLTGCPAGGSVIAYPQGAHLAAWTPATAETVVWESAHARHLPGTPVRGGIPVCFPWFGPGRSGDLQPAHGFARVSPWRLLRREEETDRMRLVWELRESDIVPDTGQQHFPHAFRAVCEHVVTDSARVGVTVENTADVAFDYEIALHAYLHVGDVEQVRVLGLDGVPYWDKVLQREQRQVGDVRIDRETDRVYHSPAPVVLEDPALGRSVEIIKEGSADTVVWNPWSDKAAAMSDFGDREWRRMICLEAGNVLDHAVCLEPGESHRIALELRVS